MLTNKEIAQQFNLLGKLMELHDENPFKIKSYANAYLNIRKLPEPLSEMEAEAINAVPGIGKAISEKIQALLTEGEIPTLRRYLDMTPPGIVEMLHIKGFGPKKIKTVWKELGVESVGELIYAVNENRLVELKGFGLKTQETLKAQLAYYLDSVGKWHFGTADPLASLLIEAIKHNMPQQRTELTGEIYRKCDVVEKIEIISTAKISEIIALLKTIDGVIDAEGQLSIKSIPVSILGATADEFIYKWTQTSCDADFWKALSIKEAQYPSVEALFNAGDYPFFIPEFRERDNIEYIDQYPKNGDNIISPADIKGCIHNHSTYSDGMNSIEEMISASIKRGHEYFVLTDHSRSAFYANGLQIERLYQQLDELTKIDQTTSDIKIFSGIESDILNDGELDYPDDVLAQLDVVIASVHSNLKMDENKATARLLKAIENPYTSILGHPTGRLLLSREGYPLNHKAIIDACARYNVAIEINANPYRLDIDWRWIRYAMEKDVLLSINPDAHSTKGIDDIYYGVCSARKAALNKYNCLNAMDLEDFEDWLAQQHEKRG